MGMLRVDLWNALFIVINLIVLYLLMKKFLVKPIMNVMQQRDEIIKNGLKNAEDSQKEADALKEKWEHKIGLADRKSREIIDQAKLDAKTEYDRIVDDAGKHAEKLIADARAAMETEREAVLKNTGDQISELAVMAAEKLLRSKSGEVGDALFDSFLTEAGDENDSE